MRFSLILTSLFYFTTWMNMVQAINVPANCKCVVVSNTKVHHSKIKEYTIQMEGLCLHSAIVFETVRGKTICSNPNNDWAKQVIQQLEKKRNEKISTPRSEPISTPTTAQSTPTSKPLTKPSSTPATAGSSPTSLSGLEPKTEPTVPPSTTTSTSSTTRETALSTTTSSPISAKSTPNPTSASPSAPNKIADASVTRSACDRILATSPTTRKASTRRRLTRRQQKKRKMKKWQKRCTKKSKC